MLITLFFPETGLKYSKYNYFHLIHTTTDRHNLVAQYIIIPLGESCVTEQHLFIYQTGANVI